MAWVPFRAPGFDVVLVFWHSMLGFEGIAVPARYGALVPSLGPLGTALDVHVGEVLHFGGPRHVALLLLGLIIVWAMPNAMVLLDSKRRRRFLNARTAAGFVGAVLTASLVAMYARSEITFLYFQF